MDHYETLEVGKNADSDTIKKAFRRKAKKVHPDKGGTAEAMAQVNQAYAVLSDESRRSEYDRTGSDMHQSSPRTGAYELLVQLFTQALNANQPDVVTFTRNSLYAMGQSARANKAQTTQKMAFLSQRRSEVSVSSGDNVFHSLVDQQLSQGTTLLRSLDRQEKQTEEALELLKSYTSTNKSVSPAQAYTTYTTSTFC